ncbi:MAG: ChaN family lipoprotein [Burkholderiales bacterium]
MARLLRQSLALAAAALGVWASAQAKECLAPGEWFATEAGTVRPAKDSDVLAQMAQRHVVLLGETHDNPDDHAWQLATLGALHLLRPDMVIGFEAFPRRAQPVLDKWIAGDLSERQLLEQTDWEKVWGWPADLYLPLFRFARINRIPMRALNVDQSLVKEISAKGWQAVPEARKEGVTSPAAPSPAYLDDLFEVYKLHPEGGDPGKNRQSPGFLHFVDSQTTWDRAMAQGLGDAAHAPGDASRPLVVGIMGSGHIRYGRGVAHQLRDLRIDSIGMLLPVSASRDCAGLAGIADAVFAVPELPASAPRPPRLGVRIEQTKDDVGIVEVVKGSLADSTGLRAGDRIVSIAGKSVARVSEVIRAVRAQPPGTWLPMHIRRDGQELDLVVKFPPAQ